MSLQQWQDNAWIHETERSSTAVSSFLGIAKREISDASVEGISADGRFTHAYNAIRSLCELALHATGYTVPKNSRQHERTIESLKFTLGGEWAAEADFFDRCRRMRHESMYDRSDVVDRRDAEDLLDAAKRLHTAVQEWLRRDHPDLV